MSTGEPIRVVLAEDAYLVREALTRLLGEAEGIELLATCESRDVALATIRELEPDVVVTDIRMPPDHAEEGIEIAARLRDERPQTGVVVLSQYAEPHYGLALLEEGTDGRAYLLKERVSDRDQLETAIRTVARAGSMIDARVVEGLIAARRRAEQSPLAELTPRELEILAFVAQGMSNQSIADELVLTKRAIEKHINAIFLKLDLTLAEDVSRRVAAALIYLAEEESLEARRSASEAG